MSLLGMLIESMAGKSGAIHGVFQDATPFQFHEENRVIDFLGQQLRSVLLPSSSLHLIDLSSLVSGLVDTTIAVLSLCIMVSLVR